MNRNVEDIPEHAGFTLGKGAVFQAYVSPMNQSAQHLKVWEIEIWQDNQNWRGAISSADPDASLHSPGLYGAFNVQVSAGGGPKMEKKILHPIDEASRDIKVGYECAGLVVLFSNEAGTDAHFETIGNAVCLE